VSTLDYERLANELTDAEVPAGTEPCPVLDLRIQELNLMLLGLRIQSLAPIALGIIAHPGPGNLLGNLFCQLAHLLDDGAVITNMPLAKETINQILGELTGGILVTLPGGLSTRGSISPLKMRNPSP